MDRFNELKELCVDHMKNANSCSPDGGYGLLLVGIIESADDFETLSTFMLAFGIEEVLYFGLEQYFKS